MEAKIDPHCGILIVYQRPCTTVTHTHTHTHAHTLWVSLHPQTVHHILFLFHLQEPSILGVKFLSDLFVCCPSEYLIPVLSNQKTVDVRARGKLMVEHENAQLLWAPLLPSASSNCHGDHFSDTSVRTTFSRRD
jgi:hypothetical protein